MEIQHLVNSFFIVRSNRFNNASLWLDPWAVSANFDGIYPYYKVPDYFASKPNWVYISHIHDDHFCPLLISKFCLDDTKFLIKHFNDSLLKRKLISFGIDPVNIFEISARSPIKLEDVGLTACIFGQLQSNEEFLESEFDYDMDTSIAIYDGEELFYNQVDCSASNDQLIDIADFCKEHFVCSEITYYSSLYGAGSEYPQCFLDLDRMAVRNSLISSKIKAVFKSVELLKPRVYIPAGASYILDDQRSNIGRFIAVPSKKELARHWHTWLFENASLDTTYNTILALTEGTDCFNLQTIVHESNSSLYSPHAILSSNQIACRPCREEPEISNVDLKSLAEKLSLKINSSLNNFSTSSVTFHILKADRLTDKEFRLLSQDALDDPVDFTFSVRCDVSDSLKPTNSLDIYFTVIDFIDWCLGRKNFNNLSCGSHLFFKREGGFDWSFYTFLCRLRI